MRKVVYFNDIKTEKTIITELAIRAHDLFNNQLIECLFEIQSFMKLFNIMVYHPKIWLITLKFLLNSFNFYHLGNAAFFKNWLLTNCILQVIDKPHCILIQYFSLSSGGKQFYLLLGYIEHFLYSVEWGSTKKLIDDYAAHVWANDSKLHTFGTKHKVDDTKQWKI